MTVKFHLEIEGVELAIYDSLDEAKRAGEMHVKSKVALLITSMASPAPSKVWRYDYEVKSWVES